VARDLNAARREAADFQRRAEKAAAALAAAKDESGEVRQGCC